MRFSQFYANSSLAFIRRHRKTVRSLRICVCDEDLNFVCSKY
jgi:hypothetical protein